MMKVNELKKLSKDELTNELMSLLREQFNLRMMQGSGQTVRSHLIQNVRKSIARVKTIIAEKNNNLSLKEGGN